MQHSSQEFPGDEATDYESIKQRIQQKPEAPVQRHSTEELLEEISELKEGTRGTYEGAGNH